MQIQTTKQDRVFAAAWSDDSAAARKGSAAGASSARTLLWEAALDGLFQLLDARGAGRLGPPEVAFLRRESPLLRALAPMQKVSSTDGSRDGSGDGGWCVGFRVTLADVPLVRWDAAGRAALVTAISDAAFAKLGAASRPWVSLQGCRAGALRMKAADQGWCAVVEVRVDQIQSEDAAVAVGAFAMDAGRNGLAAVMCSAWRCMVDEVVVVLPAAMDSAWVQKAVDFRSFVELANCVFAATASGSGKGMALGSRAVIPVVPNRSGTPVALPDLNALLPAVTRSRLLLLASHRQKARDAMGHAAKAAEKGELWDTKAFLGDDGDDDSFASNDLLSDNESALSSASSSARLSTRRSSISLDSGRAAMLALDGDLPRSGGVTFTQHIAALVIGKIARGRIARQRVAKRREGMAAGPSRRVDRVTDRVPVVTRQVQLAPAPHSPAVSVPDGGNRAVESDDDARGNPGVEGSFDALPAVQPPASGQPVEAAAAAKQELSSVVVAPEEPGDAAVLCAFSAVAVDGAVASGGPVEDDEDGPPDDEPDERSPGEDDEDEERDELDEDEEKSYVDADEQ